ncbi:MAG: hypothetical protein OXF47_01850 [Nitrospira sp.]|nr:hypothetical protein [Nitrospira sp.]
MTKGPSGQKRSGDVIGTAIKVAKINTGEVQDETMTGKEYAQKGGLIGGKLRAKNLTPERRKEIAAKVAQARWKK